MRRVREESGQVTTFVVILVAAMLLCGGLVFDGGRLLASRRQLHDVASGAARAGAQALSVDTLRSEGSTAVDITAGIAAAEDYLAASGRTGEVDVTGGLVSVTVTEDLDMVILQLAGVSSRQITGHGTAELVRGVSTGEN